MLFYHMDLAELEKEIAGGAILEQNDDLNVADEYRKEMERMSRNFDTGMNSSENRTPKIEEYDNTDDDADDRTAHKMYWGLMYVHIR